MRIGSDDFLTKSIAIHNETAFNTNNIGFMPRAFILAMLPHSAHKSNIWRRVNGDFCLSVKSEQIPYGVKSRLLLCFIASELIKTRQKTIKIKGAFYRFLQSVSISDASSNFKMFKCQLDSLVKSSIVIQYMNNDLREIKLISLSEDRKYIEASDLFFDEVIHHSLPVDLRAISLLKSSSLAVDIYCWLTYRMSYLKKKTQINWQSLSAQFGSTYKDIRIFRMKFKEQLRKVLVIYNADIEVLELGIVLKPTKPHVLKIAAH